ncbi:MAG: choice-of-anchor D domain-containing protein, partial [Nitrospirae bacterium]|nr:choice-of-anchor D domain-containing protein [Nitrospirota bacterium]
MTDKRSAGDSAGRRPPREMWDFPLRGDERPPPGLGLTEEEHVAARAAQPTPRQRRSVQDRRALRRKAGWVLMLVLLFGAIAYLLFWPSPPRAVFHPDPMSLGQQRVGIPGESQFLSITNEGERPMPISGLILRGPAAKEFELVSEDCSARELAALESCKVELELTPSAVGSREALVELQGDFRQAPVTVALAGTGIAPMLQVSSEEVDFGSRDVGSTSAASTVTVTNVGTAPLGIEAVELKGASRSDFRPQRDRCTSVSLQPGEDCSFRVAFSPRAAGRRSAEISFKSDSLGSASIVRLE